MHRRQHRQRAPIFSNQASATYLDASGASHTVTSNVVNTTVTQVASLTLTASNTSTSTANGTVYYPETLTNTGNGSDTFALSQTNPGGGNFTMTNVQFFADNGSGQPTGPALTSTGILAAGAAFKFIVVGSVPSTATSGQTNVITVTGTSGYTSSQTASVTDTTTITSGAVVAVTKSISAPSGLPGSGPYTYTLSYTNSGNATATSVTLTDIVPTGMTYVSGKSLWSVTGSTPLSDTSTPVSSGTAPNTITSSYTSSSKTFQVVIANVAAGQSGTVSFQVNVASGTAPGILNNTAQTSFVDSASGSTITGTSNTVAFNVTSTASLTLTGQTVPGPAAPGSSVPFTNVVTNTGTSTDTFNIKLLTNNFPTGTTFQLYKSDGVTPLVDTNNDGIVDTGPLAPGASYNVVVIATLPNNATNANAPYTLTKSATSTNDPTKSQTTTDQLSAITSDSVDVTDVAALGGTGVLGTGPGPESSPVLTQSVNPGASTNFSLFVNNTGPSADNYNLTASYAGAALPSGWTVSFAQPVNGSCSTTGAAITNTGTVAAGGNTQVCAIVTVPAIGTANAVYLAGLYKIWMQALSPNSGATDTIDNGVSVNTIRSLVLSPNGTGQTYPGGTYIYTHTLTNEGNVTEANGSLSTSTFSDTNGLTGWTSTLYYDASHSGTITSTDPIIPTSGGLNTVSGLSGGLAPGASITIFDKVVAPSGATTGALNPTTITVTTTTGTYTVAAPSPSVVTDNTTVISGNITLVKTQGLDATCSGSASSYSQGNINAAPGQCIMYQVTATNVGATNATTVVISDSTPTFTTLSTAAAITSPGTISSGPSVGGTGSISASVATMTPGQSVVLSFGVKINH
ncbi:MAG: hypothetical protein B7Z75_02260 [Acidocella sp. 20-57-95]|nr:MAG: hypothetical protein B7Z75_02260 [Acidocella sp. 20-57-95]HQT63827.1 hypothetical protein [Acidocella sp.]